MPEDIILYRVFIAAPRGLDDERQTFARVLNTYSRAEGIDRQALFLPIGWEDTLAGVGRPQSLINEDLDRCDYFVLILHDRWGTPPGGVLQYTSGTQEEFRRAMMQVDDPKCRLQKIVVLFKHIQEERYPDPGEQLQKVLAFKTELERSRNLLYSTFAEPRELEELLRRHLADWLRQHDRTSTTRKSRELANARAPDRIADVSEPFIADGVIATPGRSMSSSTASTAGDGDNLQMKAGADG